MNLLLLSLLFAVLSVPFHSATPKPSTTTYTVVLKEDCPYNALKASKLALSSVPNAAVKAVSFIDIGSFHAFIIEGHVRPYLVTIKKFRYVAYVEEQTEIHTAAHTIHRETLRTDLDAMDGSGFYEIDVETGTFENESTDVTDAEYQIKDIKIGKPLTVRKDSQFSEVTRTGKSKPIENALLSLAATEMSSFDRIIVYQLNAPWNLSRICRRKTHSSISQYCFDGYGCADIDAYVLDTGVYTAHPQFQDRAKSVANFSQEQSMEDLNGHGTHVAGIIGARIYGVCKNIQIKSVKILDRNGTGTSTGLFNALNWIAANHRSSCHSVINLSISGSRSPALDAAISQLVAIGIVVVTAAGNEGQDACKYSPSSSSKSLTVAALTAEDSLLTAPASNWGKCVDIYAPGAKIRSTYLNGSSVMMRYVKSCGNNSSGTSIAAPHVTGAVAIEWSRSGMRADQVTEKLIRNGTVEMIGAIPVGQQVKNIVIYVHP